MKYSVSTIRHLLALVNGEIVPDSKLRVDLFKQLEDDSLLIPIPHGGRKSWRAQNCEHLRFHLRDVYDLRDLEECPRISTIDNVSKAEQVKAVGDSKFRQARSFTGFMVNSYQPIKAELNGLSLNILPQDGTFTFIYDFESFIIPADVIIVGIENPENFRWVSRQKEFFKTNVSDSATLLFVSRYPQFQHVALTKWLSSIPNKYVHFGDLDLAGIKIYLTEYLPYLGDRASFLVPLDFNERIASGSCDRYNNQLQYADIVNSMNFDSRIQLLIDSIHCHHRGYDQEGFIDG